MAAIMTGICAVVWKISAEREHRDKMPEVRVSRCTTDFCLRISSGLLESRWIDLVYRSDLLTCLGQPHRFYPSRYWSREVIEYEKAQKAGKETSS